MGTLKLMATVTRHNPESVGSPVGNYSHGLEVSGTRFLFISGQIPEGRDGHVPSGFADQADLVWSNIEAVLHAAGMDLSHIVKVNTYLTHADQVEANRRIRQKVLRDLQPALTVMIATTLDPRWLLEIEVVAIA